MNKKQRIIYSAATVLLATSFGVYHFTKQTSLGKTDGTKVSYVKSDKSNEKGAKQGNKTIDQINSEEGISAEQIVIKITDQGYVTSHGDHFHFYNGKVPFDALISEELLMTDPQYRFKESDCVNEVKDGCIIKVNGKYYLYLKPGSKRENVRTKAQIAKQAEKGAKEAKQRGINKSSHLSKSEAKAVQTAKSQGRYTTDDGYIFSPTDVIGDMGDAFLVPHGSHFHYIPKKDLSPSELAAAQSYWNSKQGKDTATAVFNQIHKSPGNHWTGKDSSGHVSHSNNPLTPSPGGDFIPSLPRPEFVGKSFSELLAKLHSMDMRHRHVEGDGLVFEPTKVTKATEFGYVLPHGDHYHIIPRNQLSPLEITLADMYLAGQTHTSPNQPNQPKEKTPDKDQSVEHQFLGHSITAYGKGLDGKPYDTTDNYVFSKNSISDVDSGGVTAKHGEHFHYVGFGELEQDELNQVEAWLKEKGKVDQIASALTKDKPNSLIFDAKLVSRKVKKGSQIGYMMLKDGKEFYYDREQLDLTQIAFAEENLMLKDKENYLYDVVDTDGIKPELLVDITSLPMHAGNATYDTGTSFVIPHIDHIHMVAYDQLTKEQIATVKYVMLHPKDRPAVWSSAGHNQVPSKIPNVTPVEKRASLMNWQIIHSAEEVKAALNNGQYAKPDGYIFSPQDVLDEGTFNWGTSYSIPRADGSSLRSISRSELSAKELAAVDKLLAEKEQKEKSQAPVEEISPKIITAPTENTAGETSTSKESESSTNSAGTSTTISPVAGQEHNGFQKNLQELAKRLGLSPDQLTLSEADGVVSYYDQSGVKVSYDIKSLQKLN
ncbi:pneumococcal-type histidine triad protein [Streptococcus hongkongensis]